jgi:hypothetical protein
MGVKLNLVSVASKFIHVDLSVQRFVPCPCLDVWTNAKKAGFERHSSLHAQQPMGNCSSM